MFTPMALSPGYRAADTVLRDCLWRNVMKAFTLALLVLVPLASPVLAQTRPATPRMTCAASAQLVRQRGAVILSTGADLFDRYVASEGFCPTGTFARPAFVPTKDNPTCMIGYYCSSSSPFWFD